LNLGQVLRELDLELWFVSCLFIISRGRLGKWTLIFGGQRLRLGLHRQVDLDNLVARRGHKVKWLHRLERVTHVV
jgi:hypothetical protein